MTTQQIKYIVMSHPKYNGVNGCVLCNFLNFASVLSNNIIIGVIFILLGITYSVLIPYLCSIFVFINFIFANKTRKWNRKCAEIFKYEEDNLYSRIGKMFNKED